MKMLADALPASITLLTMIQPLLLIKYRLEKAIIFMWGQILKLLLT